MDSSDMYKLNVICKIIICQLERRLFYEFYKISQSINQSIKHIKLN